MSAKSITATANAASYVLPALLLMMPGTSTAAMAADQNSMPRERAYGTSFTPRQDRITHGDIEIGRVRSGHFAPETLTTSAPEHAIFVSGQAAPWHDAAVRAVLRYSQMADGWKGEGSVAPHHQAVNDALDLAFQIASEMPDIASPIIGADDEGYYSLFWSEDEAAATISIYGDGTFSFFAEYGDVEVASDQEYIGSPIPQPLVNALTMLS